MFSLRDYLDYKSKESAFLAYKQEQALKQSLSPRVPYRGAVEHVVRKPESPPAPIPPPRRVLPAADPFVQVKREAPRDTSKDVFIQRVGYIRKMK